MFFHSMLSVSVTLAKQHLQSVSYQTMWCPEWKQGDVLAKQKATTNAQLPVETNIQKVKSFRKKNDQEYKFLDSNLVYLSMIQWRKNKSEKKVNVSSTFICSGLLDSLRELFSPWSSSIKNQTFSLLTLLRFTIENQLSIWHVCLEALVGRSEKNHLSLYVAAL